MSGTLIINGLMIFFTLSTIAVIAYPIVKLLPSWLERRVYRTAAFHRDVIAALGLAIERATADPEHRSRLEAQRAFHSRALTTLVPGDSLVDTAVPAKVDAAA